MILCREEHAKAIDKAVFPGQQGGPLMHTIAAKAVALKIAASEQFRARQRQTIANAQAFAAGLEAGGIPVLTGGTDVHLVLVDLTPTGLDGQTAEDRLDEVGITVNRNAIPFDERPPMNPSGLRIGTPALTTRGMVEEEMREIAAVIATALADDFEAEKDALAERTARPDGPLPAVPAALADRRLSRLRARRYSITQGRRCRSGSIAPPPRTRWCCGRSSSGWKRRGTRSSSPPASTGRRWGSSSGWGCPTRRSASTGGLRSSARCGRSPGARRGWRGWSGSGGRTWRSPMARSTSPSSRRSTAVPSVQMQDYEFAQLQRQIAFRLARRVLVPDSIPLERLAKLGAKGEKLVRYPGLKEEYYLAGFEPDPAVLDELGLDREKVLVVVRPPPETSEYHARNDLYGGDDRPPRRRRRRRRRWSSPAPRRQGEAVRALGAANLIVPERAIDAQSLIAYADLVVSAGGTMNREAVALGTPVFTTFTGRMGGVDEALIADGRLQVLADPAALELRKRDSPGRRPPPARRRRRWSRARSAPSRAQVA